MSASTKAKRNSFPRFPIFAPKNPQNLKLIGKNQETNNICQSITLGRVPVKNGTKIFVPPCSSAAKFTISTRQRSSIFSPNTSSAFAPIIKTFQDYITTKCLRKLRPVLIASMAQTIVQMNWRASGLQRFLSSGSLGANNQETIIATLLPPEAPQASQVTLIKLGPFAMTTARSPLLDFAKLVFNSMYKFIDYAVPKHCANKSDNHTDKTGNQNTSKMIMLNLRWQWMICTCSPANKNFIQHTLIMYDVQYQTTKLFHHGKFRPQLLLCVFLQHKFYQKYTFKKLLLPLVLILNDLSKTSGHFYDLIWNTI